MDGAQRSQSLPDRFAFRIGLLSELLATEECLYRIGTALYGAADWVVWDREVDYFPGAKSA